MRIIGKAKWQFVLIGLLGLFKALFHSKEMSIKSVPGENFCKDWKFALDDYMGATKPGYNDSGWHPVDGINT